LESHEGLEGHDDDKEENEEEEGYGDENGVGKPKPRGALALTGVKASYPLSLSLSPSPSTPRRPALDGITLDIAAGTKIGICGRSGSGKSTLLSLLFGLLDLDAGTITLDGTDIDHRNKKKRLRSAINVIPQSPVLLPGSWRTNLDPTDAHADAQLWAALKTVRLDGVIGQHPASLDAEATARCLSQGQRQLFSLARALLKRQSHASIVVLDEISSSVDAATDALMREVVEREFEQQTVLVVAHRLEWVAKCDVVVVLDKGRVVEMGPPKELLMDREGFFRALWRAERG
jgi:ABC-type multidrug transport system fused ATPase/permease subunit